MSSQGPLFAGTGANDISFGSQPWSSPTAINADDGSGAVDVVIGSGNSNYLVSSLHGFSIPAGSTVNGISVEWKREATLGTLKDARVRIVKGGSIGSTDKAIGSNWPGTGAYTSYGGSADLWGLAWTPSDINSSGFGSAIAVAFTGAGTNVATVDAVRITVFYTPPPSQATVNSEIRWGPPILGAPWMTSIPQNAPVMKPSLPSGNNIVSTSQSYSPEIKGGPPIAGSPWMTSLPQVAIPVSPPLPLTPPPSTAQSYSPEITAGRGPAVRGAPWMAVLVPVIGGPGSMGPTGPETPTAQSGTPTGPIRGIRHSYPARRRRRRH